MGERRRLLYVLASGPEAPERVYAPFLLATSAAAMGVEATIYLLGDGVTVLKAGEAERIQSGSLPPLSLVIERAAEAGVRMNPGSSVGMRLSPSARRWSFSLRPFTQSMTSDHAVRKVTT